LISPSNHCITKDDCKIEEFPSSFPSLSLNIDRRERERDRMNSSGLECEA